MIGFMRKIYVRFLSLIEALSGNRNLLLLLIIAVQPYNIWRFLSSLGTVDDAFIDYTRASLILERGLEGFYEELRVKGMWASPYPPLTLTLLVLLRLLLPSPGAFRAFFFLLEYVLLWSLYLVIKRYNPNYALLSLALIAILPLQRMGGLTTLHPTTILMALTVVLSLLVYKTSKRLSYALLSLSMCLKWYTLPSLPLSLFLLRWREMLSFLEIGLSISLIALVLPLFVLPDYMKIYVYHLGLKGNLWGLAHLMFPALWGLSSLLVTALVLRRHRVSSYAQFVLCALCIGTGVAVTMTGYMKIAAMCYMLGFIAAYSRNRMLLLMLLYPLFLMRRSLLSGLITISLVLILALRFKPRPPCSSI